MKIKAGAHQYDVDTNKLKNQVNITFWDGRKFAITPKKNLSYNELLRLALRSKDVSIDELREIHSLAKLGYKKPHKIEVNFCTKGLTRFKHHVTASKQRRLLKKVEAEINSRGLLASSIKNKPGIVISSPSDTESGPAPAPYKAPVTYTPPRSNITTLHQGQIPATKSPAPQHPYAPSSGANTPTLHPWQIPATKSPAPQHPYAPSSGANPPTYRPFVVSPCPSDNPAIKAAYDNFMSDCAEQSREQQKRQLEQEKVLQGIYQEASAVHQKGEADRARIARWTQTPSTNRR